MTSDAVRLLVQLAQAEQDAGRPIPESIAAQLLALVASMYECTPAARKRRHRVTSASRERPADVPTSVTSASRERDISVPRAAALGRGVGGMGVVAVEVSTQNYNSAVQAQPKEPPSLDDLFSSEDKAGMVVHRAMIPASVMQAQQGMVNRMDGVRNGNARRKRYQGMADMVFGYWSTTYSKPSSVRMSPDRERVITRALEQNDGNLSELFFALDGARKDDWIMGRDPRSSGRYDTPETILRDRSTIERHASRIGAYGRDETHPQADLLLAALADTQPQMQGVA